MLVRTFNIQVYKKSILIKTYAEIITYIFVSTYISILRLLKQTVYTSKKLRIYKKNIFFLELFHAYFGIY